VSEKPAKGDGKVVIFMAGNSRGNRDGQRRSVDQETADRLVSQGLARLPASKS